MPKERLFVGSSVESIKLAYAVQTNLERDFEVTVWPQGVFQASQYTLDSLATILANTNFAAFIFSADDVARIRGDSYNVVRDNVIFEMGLAVGALGRDRSFILIPRQVEDLHLPSDLLGLTAATFATDRSDNNWTAALGPACDLIRTAAKSAIPGMPTNSTYPGNISCTYTNTDWSTLLSDAEHVALSVIYTSDDWHIKFGSLFAQFLARGGCLDLFLPPLHDFGSFYGSSTRVSADLSARMLLTIRRFCEMNQSNNGTLRIVILPQGFNYMFARVRSKKGRLTFIISPFPNDYSRSGSPVFQMEEEGASGEMRAFIENEVAHAYLLANAYPAFESLKYVIWREDRNRIFLSTALSCPAGCKFCYVPSLVTPRASLRSGAQLLQMCASVVSDSRFHTGPHGTKILLGAFSDPFHPENLEGTQEVLRFFAPFGNQIHIATRYPGPEDVSSLGDPKANVVFNFSLSSLEPGIEAGNVKERFSGAARLGRAGFRITLFLRPVIAELTVRDLDEIVAMARAAGISTVTIGGLYVDDRIRRRLSALALDNLDVIPKDFVLDDHKILQKLAIPDIDAIEARFVAEGFLTFLSSDQRIEYFEASPQWH